MGELISWEQALIRSHQKLFVRSFHGAPFVPGYPKCGPGWRHIVIKLVDRVSNATANYPVRFVRISEKWGRLEIYWTARVDLPQEVEHAVEEAVALAEAASACTCSSCGAEGRLFSDCGWLVTSCADHARGTPVLTPLGFANAHIVKEYVEMDIPIARCRRYDRTLDAFVDVDPEALI